MSVAAYLEWCAGRGCEPRSVAVYGSVLHSAERSIGVSLDGLTVQQAAGWLATGPSVGALTRVRAYARWAAASGLMDPAVSAALTAGSGRVQRTCRPVVSRVDAVLSLLDGLTVAELAALAQDLVARLAERPAAAQRRAEVNLAEPTPSLPSAGTPVDLGLPMAIAEERRPRRLTGPIACNSGGRA